MKTPIYRANVPKEVGKYLMQHGTIHCDKSGATFITLPQVFTIFDGVVYKVYSEVVPGKIESSKDALNLGICPACGGGSKFESKSCYRCKGTGREAWAVEDSKQCDKCHGVGKVRLDIGNGNVGLTCCNVCDGTGIR